MLSLPATLQTVRLYFPTPPQSFKAFAFVYGSSCKYAKFKVELARAHAEIGVHMMKFEKYELPAFI